MEAEELHKDFSALSVGAPDSSINVDPSPPDALGDASLSYQKLDDPKDQIRLLTIHPGGWRIEIDCTTRIVSLETRPVYKALSYVWGNPERSRWIRLNGKAFGVSQNLWNALHWIRNQNEELVIWADAICINQNDDIEKTHQVGLMKDVFANCEEALLFLGGRCDEETLESAAPPESVSAKAAFELLDLFALDRHLNELPCYTQRSGGMPTVSREYEHRFQDLEVLCDFEWWERIWTVQEAVLPRKATFVWGRERYPMRSLAKALRSWMNHRKTCCSSWYWNFEPQEQEMDTLYHHAESIFDIRDRVNARHGVWLITARQYCVERKASDHRDFYFGLLGITNTWGSNGPFIPDYSTSAKESIINAVDYMMFDSWGALQGQRSVFESLGFPSWLPDWTISTTSAEALYRDIRIDETIFCAAGRTKWKYQIKDNSVLALKGLRIDTLVKVAGTTGTNKNQVGPVLLEWMEFLSISDLPSSTNLDPMVDSFWRTAVSDQTLLPGCNGRRVVPTDYEIFATHLRNQKIPKKERQMPGFSEDTGDLLDCYAGRLLFVTDSGTLGNAYPEARQGDEVYILLGCSLPFLLRRCKEKTFLGGSEGFVPSFQVFGNCYLHGFMDGEALVGDWEERVETIALV